MTAFHGTGAGPVPLTSVTPDAGLPEFAFFVEGDPAPQGSLRHVGGGRLVSQSKRVGPWRQAVKKAAEAAVDAAADFAALDVPVCVLTNFVVTRPKTVKAVYPTSIHVGDLDKLVRATWDGLVQGGLLADDKYVVNLGGSKRYAYLDEEPGCFITVEVLS